MPEKTISDENVGLSNTLIKGYGYILMVFQLYLYTENLCERIVMGLLKRGDKLIDREGLTMHKNCNWLIH
ncbi:MAG: hypothetical protein AABY49_02975 [Planctomycetota bacterium]